MNLADQRAVRKQKQKADLDKKRELDDLKAVASTFQGRRFLFRLLNQTNTFGLYFDQEHPHMNSFYEGLRSLGATLFNDLHAVDPGLYATMVREANNQAQTEPDVDKDADILYHPNSHVTIPKQEDVDDERDTD